MINRKHNRKKFQRAAVWQLFVLVRGDKQILLLPLQDDNYDDFESYEDAETYFEDAWNDY